MLKKGDSVGLFEPQRLLIFKFSFFNTQIKFYVSMVIAL